MIVLEILALLCLGVIRPSLTSLEVKGHYDFEYTEPVTYYSLGWEEAIEKVNNFMNVHYNLEIVDDLGYSLESGEVFQILGLTTFYNNVKLVKQDSWSVMWTLTHELVHVKYQSINETWTNFKTWTLLHESNDEVLVNVARWNLHKQLNGSTSKEYDITWYCYNYLQT